MQYAVLGRLLAFISSVSSKRKILEKNVEVFRTQRHSFILFSPFFLSSGLLFCASVFLQNDSLTTFYNFFLSLLLAVLFLLF